MTQAAAPEGAALPYRINDADNHFIEPEDLFVRYIDPKWREKVVEFVTDADGNRVELYAGKPSKLAASLESAPRTEAELDTLARSTSVAKAEEGAPRPGDGGARAPGMFLNRLNPYRKRNLAERRALLQEFKRQESAWGDRDGRLALMDEQGIHAALMFPGHVLGLEFEFQDDVDAIYANARAYNRWIQQEVGYAAEDRLFLPAYLSLADPELAVKELERVLKDGARVILLMAGHAHGGRANPRGGRSIADPIYDPVWARIDESGARVATHLGATDYGKYGADLSENPEHTLRDFGGLQWALFWGDRPAMDTVASAIMHNLFGRFPNLRICLSEQGCVWLPYILRKLDHAFMLGRESRFGRLERRPREIFREHFVVAPFPEENVPRVVAEVGIEPIVFGSDFPHAEGLAFPADYAAAQLAGLPDDQVKSIMRDNLARFLELPA